MKTLKRKLAIAGVALALAGVMLLVTVVANFMQVVISAGSSMNFLSESDTRVGRISFADTSGDTKSLLDLSLCFIGTPYEFGQATTTTTDCSGFILQAYELSGTSIFLPHSADQQSDYGSIVFDGMYGSFTYRATYNAGEISIPNTGGGNDYILPGDLIFFDFGQAVTEGTAPIGHVAMYIGNGQIIHSLNEEKDNLISCIMKPNGSWNTEYTDHIVMITHLLDYNSTQTITSDLTGNPIQQITENDVYALGYYLTQSYPSLTTAEQYQKAVEIVNLARGNKTSISQEVANIMKVYNEFEIDPLIQRAVRCALIGTYWELPVPTPTPSVTPTPLPSQY
jgi:cell wall-associated NlpC family hydrolase